MSEIIVTLIRHGESLDNRIRIWAGWKDSPFSDLGKRQADALGSYFSTTDPTTFHAIYSSPLLRAFMTGEAVHTNHPEPKPHFIKNPNLREQYFGIAEGHSFLLDPAPEGVDLHKEFYDKKVFPVGTERDFRFPDGESRIDLARRADIAIQEIVVPHIKEGVSKHIAITSHGLCISELVSALLRLDPTHIDNPNARGLSMDNTAWTRATLKSRVDHVEVNGIVPQNVVITHINEKDHLVQMEPEVPNSVTDEKAIFSGNTLQEE